MSREVQSRDDPGVMPGDVFVNENGQRMKAIYLPNEESGSVIEWVWVSGHPGTYRGMAYPADTITWGLEDYWERWHKAGRKLSYERLVAGHDRRSPVSLKKQKTNNQRTARLIRLTKGVVLIKYRTARYLIFDAVGTLLYVGVAYNPPGRWVTHARDAPWWPDAVTFTIEWYPTRALAERAEEHAIRTMRPLHNIAHQLPVAP